jgi:hypothetical protein
MRLSKFITLAAISALCLSACSAEIGGIAPENDDEVATEDLRGRYVIYEANRNGGQPHRIGGCNVWFAYETPNSIPLSGEVPPNVGRAYMTGDVNACARACGDWRSSYVPGYAGTRYVHRQLYVYDQPVVSLDNYTYPYEMECLVVDHEQWCLPAYDTDDDGEIDLEDAVGEVYCENG